MRYRNHFAALLVTVALIPTATLAHSVSGTEPAVHSSFTDGVEDMVRGIVRDPAVDAYRAKVRKTEGTQESSRVAPETASIDENAQTIESFIATLQQKHVRVSSVSASSTEVRLTIAYKTKAFKVATRTVIYSVIATPKRTTVTYARRSGIGTDAGAVAQRLEGALETAGLQGTSEVWTEADQVAVITALLDALPRR